MQSSIDKNWIHELWDKSIVPNLVEYIKIPNKSPAFDADWKKNGYMSQAVELMVNWVKEHGPDDMILDVIDEGDRTPFIYIEIPGAVDNTVLLYGHLDKQPEMTGWEEGLGPWIPVIRDNKLYGRGGADDGYSIFAAITAIMALRRANIPHSRCVITIEACEESGSYDLPHYIEMLKDRIGDVELVICLDSGCGNYDQLWTTTSLRGMVSGQLRVDILKEGIHSGIGSGIAPSSFRIARRLLERIEDSDTGEILLPELKSHIPEGRVKEAAHTAKVLGSGIVDEIPFVDGVSRSDKELDELLLSRTWESSLCVTGVDGIPPIENAGNVSRPYTTLTLSFRLPPLVDPKVAAKAVKSTLERESPYGAKVSFEPREMGSGWNAPATAEWLQAALDEASLAYYDKPAASIGEGGSIPFMGMLGEMFPKAQFMIVGVLGPKSNAHGPNEFLHIPMAKNLTACVAHVISCHAKLSA